MGLSDSQFESFVELRKERSFLHPSANIWGLMREQMSRLQFYDDVGVGVTVRVHWDKVTRVDD